jgi:hypothetical protein
MVDLPAISVRHDAAHAFMWQDQTDLALFDGRMRIDIKSRRLCFTSPEDYPTGCLPAFVDTTTGYQAKSVKPHAYVIVSQTTGAMMFVNGRRPHEWRELARFDRVRGIHERFYAAPKECLRRPEQFVAGLRKWVRLNTPEVA